MEELQILDRVKQSMENKYKISRFRKTNIIITIIANETNQK